MSIGVNQELQYDALETLGFDGTLPEKELLWLLDNGPTSNIRSEAWVQMLASKGRTEPRDVAWNILLGDEGYTGTLKEKERMFWIAGGVFS